MYHKILIPVAYEPGFDLSREVGVARELSAPGASVTMLHAMDPVPFYAIDYMPEGWTDELVAAIEADMRAQGAALPDLHVEIVQDDAARAILDWARLNEADCIVLASHRSDRTLFGSTAAKIARHAPCAVHLIR